LIENIDKNNETTKELYEKLRIAEEESISDEGKIDHKEMMKKLRDKANKIPR
jgi:hypothetical protein